MKTIALAATLSLVATVGFAGNPAPVALEPQVIVADTSSSSHGVLVPVLALIFLAAGLAD